jgi:hypothetical protein
MYHTHVVDPETGEIIPLYNEKIYKLLNSGVSLTDLKPYVSEKYNRNSLFTNDLICEYLKYFNGYRHMKALLLVDKSTTTLINNKYVWKKIFIKHKFPHYGEYNLSNFIKIKNASIRTRNMLGKHLHAKDQNISNMPFLSSLFSNFVGFNDIIITITNKSIDLYRRTDNANVLSRACHFTGYREMRTILFELHYYNNATVKKHKTM